MKTNTEATMTTQDSQSELREKLTCIMGGCIGSHENCFYETIEDAEIGSAEETKQMVDMQISLIEAYVTTRVKEATISVQQDLEDMKRFIAALLVQSGGVVTVTKRTLIEIPTPSKIDFEQLANVDGSITMALRQDDYEALTTTTNGREE